MAISLKLSLLNFAFPETLIPKWMPAMFGSRIRFGVAAGPDALP